MQIKTSRSQSRKGGLWRAFLAFALLAATVAISQPLAGAQDESSAAFDEAVDGEISDDAASPTVLAVAPGSNLLNGSVVAGDIDYVTVTVPEGYELSALTLAEYESANDLSFIAIQAGSEFTEGPSPQDTDVANLLGFTLFGTDTLGTDILPAIGAAEDTQGFAGALGSGDYTFWIQETADGVSSYSFDLNISLAADAPADDAADAPADDAPADEAAAAEAVLFSVENLQPADGFFFTPVWAGLHSGDFDLFNNGERASAGLEVLAETGATGDLSAEFAARGRLDTTVGGGPIAPGATVEGSIDIINPSAYPYLSVASMIIPSNDAFFGNEVADAFQIFDADGNFTGPITIDFYGEDLYDSGTEVNTASGAAGFSLGFDGEGSGESTDDPTGTVGLHQDRLENIVGIQTAAGTTIGSDGSGFLEENEPIARITVYVGDAPVEDAPADDAADDAADAPADDAADDAADAPADDAADDAADAPADDAADDAADAPADDAADDAADDGPARVEIVNLGFERYLEVQPNVNVYTSNQSNTATEYYLIPVDGLEDTYLIKSVSTGLYLHGNSGGEYNYNVNVVGPVDDTAYWTFFEADNGGYHLFNVGLERLLQADRDGFNVDTNGEVIEAMEFGLDVEWAIIPAEG